MIPVMFLSGGIISSKLYHLWGTRAVGMIGGFLTSIGFLIAAFSKGNIVFPYILTEIFLSEHKN
jgi:hypothetical protein